MRPTAIATKSITLPSKRFTSTTEPQCDGPC